MGAAASALSPSDAAHVTQALKRKLALYQTEHLCEDEIRIKLSNDYHEIVDSLQKDDKSPKISGESGSQKSGRIVSSKGNQGNKKERDGLTAKFGGKKDTKGKGNSTTRRRSFDQNTIVKKSDIATPVIPVALPNEISHSQLPTLSESDPAPLLPSKSMNQTSTATAAETPNNLNEIADSWDSVSQQPFCKICQMAFKSESFLERHIKFSDLHAQNMKKKEKLDEAAKSGAPLPPLISDRMAPRQVEGEHFKMMYTGSKFFWRTQESVDLHFYHHLLPHTIEIISYDTTKSREFNRIYLDYSTLLDIVIDTTKAHAHDAMRQDMAKRQVAEENKEENSNEPSAHAVGSIGPSFGSGKLVSLRHDEDAQRTAMTTFILQRLQLQSVTTTAAGDAHSFVPPLSPGKAAARELLNSASSPTLSSLTANAQVNGSVMVFAKLTGDDYKRSPVLEKPPIVLVPVVVTRRRRTNAEEIDATISSLTSDRQALAAATGKAEKVANLVYSSASQISSVKWWAKLSPWRRKWVWAIRRVIRQRLVADTKRNLAEREAVKQNK